MTRLLNRLLERAADRTPDATAVVDGDVHVSYEALDRRANRFASLLVDCGVERGDRVAISLDKSAEAIAALYGIMKAGAAYVPVDARGPVSRTASILDNCGVRHTITSSSGRAAWPAMAASGVEQLIVTDALMDDEPPSQLRVRGKDELEGSSDGPCRRSPIADDLAYVLNTSGSTGVPKGVGVSHANSLAFVEWAARTFAIGAADRLSSHAPLHFDLSTFDLFAAAHGGAAVVLVPPRASLFPVEVGRFIAREEITTWYSVPSVLTMVATRGGLRRGDLPTLRNLLFAGEVFPTKHLRSLMDALPHVRFSNLYGPTETNVCTWYDVPRPPPSGDDAVPIGRPIDDTEVYVVDEQGGVLPDGEVGELWVRGPTVMQGYFADPGANDRALVANPFLPGVRDVLYRTGDLAHRDPGGMLHLVGRRDAQVKSRGHRIELGEVETAILAFPGVTECAVVARPDEVVTNTLHAYVAGEEIDAQALARHCSAELPRYMVPEIRVVDRLPLTPTGKIDRTALRALAQDSEGTV